MATNHSKREEWARALPYLFVLGLVLRASGALSPMHELMHALTAQVLDVEVTKLSWAKTWVVASGVKLDAITLSGFWLEFAL